MAVSKVVYGNQTLIDLTGDTVTADAMLSGVTATNAAGNRITGNLNPWMKTDGEVVRILKCSGSTPANTTSGSYAAALWKATDSNITELYDGLTVAIRLDVAGHGTYGTLFQVNSLDAKPVVANTNTMVGTRYPVGSTVIAIYNSTQTASAYVNNVSTTFTGCWQIADYDSTNVWQMRRQNAVYKTKTALYRFQLLLPISETELIPVNSVDNNTGTNKTLTTESFDPFGQIHYYNNTNTVNANNNIPSGRLYEHGNMEMRYSFNTGYTLTSYKAVYLKCSPQSDGRVKLATGNPVVQELPTTADGYVYILLGQSFNSYQIDLQAIHPVYQFVDGSIRLWTGVTVPTKTSELTNDSGFTTSTDLANYLPLAGGTMTGTIVSSIQGLIKRNNNTGTLVFSGGSDTTYSSKSGSLLTLYGSSMDGADAGAFRLTAMASGGTYKELKGLPDGTLNWDSNPVITGVKHYETSINLDVSSSINIDSNASSGNNKESWRYFLGKNSAQTTNTGSFMQMGVQQIASSRDFIVGFRVGNPRSGNLPSAATGVNSGNEWAGIFLKYYYDKNYAFGYLTNTPTLDTSSAIYSARHIATVGNLKTALGDYLPLAGGSLAGAVTSSSTFTASGFIGDLTGNADTATKAEQDASGNVITTTYATKAELPTINVVESGTGYIRYSDGTQICWGANNTTNPPANIDFPKAFSEAPGVLISGKSSAVDMQMRLFKAAAISSTGFTPVATNVAASSYSATTYQYVAFGKWSNS